MIDHSPSIVVETNAPETINLRGKRHRIEKDLGPGMFTYSLEEDPRTYKEVVSLTNADIWMKALDDEIKIHP